MDPLGIALSDSAPTVAQRLVGSILERTIDGNTVRVRIVETEAYDQADAASHSNRGETNRTRVMFGPPGHLYVYFSYGMHYCCNIVTGPKGTGAAVLIRAVEPLDGEEIMHTYRDKSGIDLTNGPAKLCQALGIDLSMNGHDLREEPLRLHLQTALAADEIIHTTRIGISRAVDVPWRFYLRDNPYVSRR